MQTIDLTTAEEYAHDWCWRMAQIMVSKSTANRYSIRAYDRPQITIYQLERLCQYVGEHLSKRPKPQKYILSQLSKGFYHSMDLEECHEKIAKSLFDGAVNALTSDTDIEWHDRMKMMQGIHQEMQNQTFPNFQSEGAIVVTYDFEQLLANIDLVVRDVLTPLAMSARDHENAQIVARIRPFAGSM